MILRKKTSQILDYKIAQENVIYIKKNIVTPPSSVGGEGEFSKIVKEDFHKNVLY